MLTSVHSDRLFYRFKLDSFLYHAINQTSAIKVQTPPIAYDTCAGSDNPSGAMQMYVEHTSVINRAGRNAI